MSKKLQDNEVSSTTKDRKIKYSKFNLEFCLECQDTRKKLGHSSVNCPEIVCLNCLKYGQKIKGHHAGICIRKELYWPEEQIGPVHVQKTGPP